MSHTKTFEARVDKSADKVSDGARIARGHAAGEATNTPEYNDPADPTFKNGIDSFLLACTQLSAAIVAVVQLLAALAKARGAVLKARLAWNKAFNLATTLVEHRSQSVADVVRFGFQPLNVAPDFVAPPDKLAAAWNPKTGAVDVRVGFNSGARPCIVAATQDLAVPPVAVPGAGTKRALEGLAKGTWYVFAATLHAGSNSAFIGPIAVVVK